MSATDAIIEAAIEDVSITNKHSPLAIRAVEIDEHCVGDRWSVDSEDAITQLIAIVAMGQAAYAAAIIRGLYPLGPAFSDIDLCNEAIVHLTVQEGKQTPRVGYPRWHRDGFMFEVISWLAARQSNNKNAYLKDPHISATSQGLDGLMIEVADDRSAILRTTVFEDKCTDDPRRTFVDKVLPAFKDRHSNARSAELIATATCLLRNAGVDDAASAKMAAAVLNRSTRHYRASFALTQEHDLGEERKVLFKGFEGLSGISPNQRIGAGLILEEPIRDWFGRIAASAVMYLEELKGALTHV